jgi:predicted transcriptional regulator
MIAAAYSEQDLLIKPGDRSPDRNPSTRSHPPAATHHVEPLKGDHVGVTLVVPAIQERTMSGPVATTLKIAADLKRRVVAAAKAADQSPHAFMLDAIERQTSMDEQRRAFVADAVASRGEALKSGKGYAAADVHRYVAARVRGGTATRPKAQTWLK